MFAFARERGAARLIDEQGRGVRKAAVRIGGCLAPFGLEEERPASAEALQHVVRPRAGRDQLGLGGGFEIGSAEAEHPQEAAVLVENDTGRDQRRSEEHTSELQSLMRISYAVFCLTKNTPPMRTPAPAPHITTPHIINHHSYSPHRTTISR